MDGHFVPEITIGPVIVEAVRRASDLPIDAHLMIAQPERHVERFVRAGAASLTVHAEAVTDLGALIQRIKALGAKAAVALNPPTAPQIVEPVLGELDMVLLMTVHPGYAGQRLLESVLPKFRLVREWIDARAGDVDLQADGGINEETAPQVVAAGANVLVAASAIFAGAGGIEASVRRLRAAAEAALPPDRRAG